MMRLPQEIENEVLSFIRGERNSGWVHEFLQKGITANHNYIYERTYNIYLMDDILVYLKKYYPEQYKKWRKRWKKNLKHIKVR